MGAYLIRVWRRLGYPGRKPTPVLDDEADFYLDGGLLEPVIARGPIYRPTPDEAISEHRMRPLNPDSGWQD